MSAVLLLVVMATYAERVPFVDEETRKRNLLEGDEYVVPLGEHTKLLDEVVPVIVVPRRAWGARPPTDGTHAVQLPVKKVKYSYIDLSKFDEYLPKALRKCQDHFMDERKLCDIPFNFIVGSGGVVFEGRGWRCSPATAGSKGDHLNIAFIGDYGGETTPPSYEMCDAGYSLVQMGVKEEVVDPNYETIPIKDSPVKTLIQEEFYETLH